MNKVAVIGGGFSGIYALKYCLNEKLDCTLFEKSSKLGGVWDYNSNKNTSMLKDTYASSSISYLNPLDFPFPKDTPTFPHNRIVLNHLLKYVDHFNLNKHIKLSTTITQIIKINNKWKVSYTKNKKIVYEYFDKIIICTGVHQEPNIPNDKMYNNFHKSSHIIHSSNYEKNKHILKNKKVLIVGGGETANDIAINLINYTKHKIYVSIRNGQWFLGKTIGAYEAADLNYNRLSESLRYKYTLNLYKYVQTEMWGAGGSGVKEWEPKFSYFNSYFTKGREIIEWISKGQIEPCGSIKSIDGKKIVFENKEASFDYIILCTGYKTSYLSKLLPNINHNHDKYKLIFNTDDNTLSYCGFIRPIIGSLPMISEIQAKLISLVYSNKIELVNKKKQLTDIHYRNNIEKGKKTSNRLNYIVLPYSYCDELAILIGCKPNLMKLFFNNHVFFWKVLIYPWSQYHYTIQSPDKKIRNIAVQEINIICDSLGGNRLLKYILLITIGGMYILYKKLIISMGVILYIAVYT